MASLRSKLLRESFKKSRLLNEHVTAENLLAKRAAYARLEKRFPVPGATTVESVQKTQFKGEWVTTPKSRADKVLLYFHGGGFIFDSTKLHRDLISRIASEAGVRAFSLDYSLAPEHPFPTAVHEALASYEWLLEQYEPENIVFGGDSAGGSIALSLLHVIRERQLPFPACVVAMSPGTDAADVGADVQPDDPFMRRDSLSFFIDAYFQGLPLDHPVASPLHGELKGFPPILIHVDTGEIMYSNAMRFAEKAKAEGVDVTLYEVVDLWHVWHLSARYIPEAKTAIAQIGEYIQAQIG